MMHSCTMKIILIGMVVIVGNYLGHDYDINTSNHGASVDNSSSGGVSADSFDRYPLLPASEDEKQTIYYTRHYPLGRRHMLAHNGLINNHVQSVRQGVLDRLETEEDNNPPMYYPDWYLTKCDPTFDNDMPLMYETVEECCELWGSSGTKKDECLLNSSLQQSDPPVTPTSTPTLRSSATLSPSLRSSSSSLSPSSYAPQQPQPIDSAVSSTPSFSSSPSSSITSLPSMIVMSEETLVVPVNVFLTGVPDGSNMTIDEQETFEQVLLDMLVPRLGTVNVKVVDVITDYQIPNPEDYIADESSFQSEEGNEVIGSEESNVQPAVLQAVMNITLSHTPPPPDGVRDWSTYIKSWIESFGNTMVEIFTSPKHPQHPQTNSPFWDDLVDVSATNIDPPNTEPTISPTPEPEPIIIYPDNSNNTYIIAGVCVGVGLAICAFCGFLYMKARRFKQRQAEDRGKELRGFIDNEESSLNQQPPQAKVFAEPVVHSTLSEPLKRVTEVSSDDHSSGSSYSSSGSDSNGSSSYGSASSNEEDQEEEEESVHKNGQSVTAQSQSFNSEGNTEAPASSYEKGIHDSKSTDGEERSEAVSSALRSSGFASRESGRSSTEESSNCSRSLESAGHVKVEEQTRQLDDIIERVVANDPTLKHLNLDGTGHDCISEELWNALASNSNVEHLSLRECNLTDEDAASLSLALGDNTSITHIWLGENDIGSEGVEYLIATLESNQTIVLLDLASNSGIDQALEDEVRAILEPRESIYITDIMRRVRDNDPTLTELNLVSMSIGLREDILSLFDALGGNRYVQVIDLSRNEIDDDGVSAISSALLENISVTHLNLSDNIIFSEGAEHLIVILDSNNTLEDINLGGNMIEQEILDEINSVLMERRPGKIEASQSQTEAEPSTTAATSASEESNQEVDSLPPMHEVEEESDAELEKRKAIMAIMKDTSIPWKEKNKRILEAQNKFYVAAD